MTKTTYCNIEYTFKQERLFNVSEFKILENDPVMELRRIMEVLDLREFKKAFRYKTKVNSINLLSVIIYAYSRKITSCREIETYCQENIKFRFLLDAAKAPDHSTISRFLNKCEPFLDKIYTQFNNILLNVNNIDTENIYIDGTKLEAYANKYTFVWKKSVLRNLDKMLPKIEELINDFNNDFLTSFNSLQDILTYLLSKNIQIVQGRGCRKTLEQKYLEQASSFFKRSEKYQEHLENLGDRNSYSKTDVDATFMRMKEDHMLNGQLKPGYNLQIGVCSNMIVGFKIFSNPTDVRTLIPFLEYLKGNNVKLTNIVADAGYESYENYEYINNNNLVPYIKPQMYEKSKTRKFKKNLNRPENLIYDEDSNRLFRKDGLELEYVRDYVRSGIKFKQFYNPETETNVYYNYVFRQNSNKSLENITTEFGKKLRLNRSIQVEGAFSVIKETLKLRRLKVRGLSSVNREIAFVVMGYNFKMHVLKLSSNQKGNVLHDLKVA